MVKGVCCTINHEEGPELRSQHPRNKRVGHATPIILVQSRGANKDWWGLLTSSLPKNTILKFTERPYLKVIGRVIEEDIQNPLLASMCAHRHLYQHTQISTNISLAGKMA